MTDISQYLLVAEDGKVWWRLDDACRLGAGFQPASTGSSCDLRAPGHAPVSYEATLRAAFLERTSTLSRPRVIRQATGPSVPAREFLFWLAQYRIEAESDMPFPAELARAVANAETTHAGNKAFFSRLDRLEGWFDKPMNSLPVHLRELAVEVMVFTDWDDHGPSQRRKQAIDFDQKHDPAFEGARQYWWDFYAHKGEIQVQIEQCTMIRAETVAEINARDVRLARLRAEIAEMDEKFRRLELRDSMVAVPVDSISTGDSVTIPRKAYLAFPVALERLADRLGATVHDVAVWVWLSGTRDELPAYSHIYELDPPPRFRFPAPGGRHFDYVAPLMGAYFLEMDLDAYTPPDHYITGKDLLERWAEHTNVEPEAFIAHRVIEGRLPSLHPISGQTQWEHPGDEDWPPRGAALFELTKVLLIEEADLLAKAKTVAVDPSFGEPVSEAVLVECFKVIPRNADENQKWWRKRLADAKKTQALSECRAALGKRGKKGSSMWYPGRVALWLADRDHMAQAFVAKALRKNFPELNELADQLDPPEG